MQWPWLLLLGALSGPDDAEQPTSDAAGRQEAAQHQAWGEGHTHTSLPGRFESRNTFQAEA